MTKLLARSLNLVYITPLSKSISKGTNGGINALHNFFAYEVDAVNVTILSNACVTYLMATKWNVNNRDLFEPNGSKLLCKHLSHQLDKYMREDFTADSKSNIETFLINGLNLAKMVAKSENNKFMLMKNGAAEIITLILKIGGTKTAELSEKACLLMKELCIHDDMRREMSCAVDNGKHFLAAEAIPELLMKFSSAWTLNSSLASAAMTCARNLVTTEESVQIMVQNGAMDLPMTILTSSEASVTLVRSLLGFMRNLCADDIRKDKFVAMNVLPQMTYIMNNEKYSSDAMLIEHGIACWAQMALRNPSNSYKIVSCGAIDITVKSMHRYYDNSALLRQGCLCIRNIAARCLDLHDTLLDAGVEAVLRIAGKHQAAIDEAYAGLRDLKCEVQYVKINLEDGSAVVGDENAYTKKPNFNPIYDDTVDIEKRVEDNAMAPFAANNVKPFEQL